LTIDVQRMKLCASLVLLVVLTGCKQKQDQPKENLGPSQPQPVASEAAPSSTRGVNAQQAVPKRPSGPIQFVDVTAQAGISFKHNSGAFGKKYLPETMGSGACFIDFDNDGWQDILLVNSMDWSDHQTHKSYPALYHNNKDGTFTDVTREAGLAIEMYGMGCAVGDFDNDGFDDIYITAVGGNQLFHNTGKGKFADVTQKAGVSDPGFSTSAIWFDYDNDGKLDLFVLHYVTWSRDKDLYCTLDGKNKSYCTPDAYKGESATLYHNKGNGVFEDVTKHAGLYDPSSKSLGVAMLDYDNDGWMDLFVSNDTQRNKLYHNNHDGTFTETGELVGVAYGESGGTRAGMGTDAGDFDHSGRQSLVVGNFTNEGMTLYRDDGTGLFSDQSLESGVSQPSLNVLTFGSFFFDYNLDGLLDIFALDGHVADDISALRPTLKYAEPPLLFRNEGKSQFEDVTGRMGPALQRAVVGRGAAYADFDNDGDLDLLLTTNNGPARLLRNENGNQNDMLRVKVVGTRSNRDGIGAKITMTSTRGPRQFAIVKSGSSYLSQSELPITFGLGKPDEERTVSLELVWPSGKKDSIVNIKPNQFVTVQEGKGIIAQQPIVFAPAEPQSNARP
jgi:enediyne biosynthesis protein E4